MSKVTTLIAPLRALSAVLLLALAGFGLAPRALAQANAHPPERMTYQGYLVDANGTALGTNAPKNYDVIFRIWNSESGTAAGNRLWTEQQTVTVDKGYFSVLLGEGSSIGEARPELSTLFTNATASDRWVGLTVKGIGAGGTDVNILPRLRLLTSPYAFLARGVSGAGVVSANNLDPVVANALWTGNGANIYRAGGNVGIGISNPGFPLSFATTLGDKISLWGNSGAHYGLGVQGGLLQIHTDAVGADVAFGYGSSSAMTETMRITGGGRLIVQGGVLARGGAPGGNGSLNNGYAFSGSGGDNDSGMFSSADGLVQFYSDNIERMRIHPGGNVGIGQTVPSVKLDVAGTMRVDNGLTAAPANGTFGSSGTRLTLWPGDASNPPYAFGIAGGTLWSGVPSGAQHRWYCGTGSKMNLYNNANLEIFDGGAGVGGRLQVGTGGFSDVAVTIKANPADNYMVLLMDSGGNYRHLFHANGTAYKTGAASWATWSDVQLKRNVQTLHGALDQLLGLRSVTFEYLNGKAYGEGMYRGFIAQEVEKVFPDWVSEAPDGMKAVECRGFESLTVEALRELRAEKNAQIKQLSDENTSLRATLAAQEQRLASLETLIRSTAAKSPDAK